MDEMEIVRRLYHIFYMMRKEGVAFSENKEHHHAIRGRDLMLLDMIVQNGNMMKMSDISTYFNITPAAVSQIIRLLENKNWVERVILDNDRRSVYIVVSDIGITLIKENEQHVTEKIVELLAVLGEEDGEALIRILEKFRAYFKKMKEDKHCTKGDTTC